MVNSLAGTLAGPSGSQRSNFNTTVTIGEAFEGGGTVQDPTHQMEP